MGALNSTVLNGTVAAIIRNALYRRANIDTSELDDDGLTMISCYWKKPSQLLRDTSDILEATDPRDHVYALLGITHIHGESTAFVPDYSKPFADVMITTMRGIVEEERSLDILSTVSALKNNSSNSDLPSRVLDSRQQRKYFNFPFIGSPFCASHIAFPNFTVNGGQALTPIIYPSDSEKDLCLLGALVERIETVLDVKPLETDLENVILQEGCGWNDIFAYFKNFATVITAAASTLTAGTKDQSVELQVLHTLLADALPSSPRLWDAQYHNHLLQSFGAHLRAYTLNISILQDVLGVSYSVNLDDDVNIRHKTFNHLYTLMFSPARSFSPEEDEFLDELARELAMTAPSRLMRHSFIITQSYMGPASDIVEPGDHIHRLMGGNIPSVLRKSDREAKWQFLCDCYLHGVMDGELWTGPKEQEDVPDDGKVTVDPVAMGFGHITLV